MVCACDATIWISLRWKVQQFLDAGRVSRCCCCHHHIANPPRVRLEKGAGGRQDLHITLLRLCGQPRWLLLNDDITTTLSGTRVWGYQIPTVARRKLLACQHQKAAEDLQARSTVVTIYPTRTGLSSRLNLHSVKGPQMKRRQQGYARCRLRSF